MEEPRRRIVPKKTSEPVQNARPIIPTKEEFFGYIVSASMIGHMLHLQTKAFAEHVALNSFYEDILANADSIIETYQGACNCIVEYELDTVLQATKGLCALDYLKGLRSAIQESRYDIIPRDMSNIHNEMDNFITTIDVTVYKLTFLN